MAIRDLIIDIKSRFDERGSKAAEEGLKKTEEAAKRSQRELERMERAAAKTRDAMESSGQTMALFGAAALAGIGVAVKAAIEWESAWTGVTKTVEGTPAQMAALEGALRGLARELPATHKEIAAVAEAAGQLGIKRESIVSFTTTMIALGETTNLSAEQAATAMARLSNIMGTPQQEIGKLGASLVALGNAGASTEAEIVEMALRIAGAGKTIGLSEGQVLGFANALSSVGINAEAGGSSISRVMITIAQAVDTGGASVERFAKVAGMSAADFSTAFQDDAGGALAAFIEGLGRVEASGGSLFSTLQQLGFSEIEVRDALLRTAQAGSLLTDSLRLGERAWVDNSALVEEAAKRYETTASKMQVAQNNVTDLGITIGETFLPVLGDVAEHTSGWITMLQELPGPVKTAGGVVAGMAGTVALAGGAAMIAVPKMVEFTKTLADMGPRGAAMASRLSSLGAFLTGPWGIALAAAAGAMVLFADSKAQATAKVEIFRKAIEADSGALAAHTREAVIAQLQEEGLLEIAQRLGINLKTLTDAAMGNKGAIAEVNAQLTQAAGPADVFHTKVRSLADGTKVLSGDQMLLQQRLQGINTKLTEGAESHRRHEQAMGASGSTAKSLTGDLNIQGVAAQDLTKFLKDLATSYSLTGDDAVKAAQQMIDSWSKAYVSFGNMTGAITDLESAASGSGTSAADRQADAVKRLAEVQRDGAEKIKRAQRDVADAHEQAAEQVVESQERIKAAQESLASAVEDAAQREADAVQGVADARQRVADSQEALTAATERAAQREADTAQKVADARQRLADVAEESGRKIESASQRVADAQADAAQRELDAEQRLQDSHARTAQAVEDLTAARERAAERLEDLARSQASSALDEEGAQIAIERARQRLDEVNADPTSSSLDRQEADLAFRRAVQRLEEIRQRNADLQQEIDDANRAGIEGSAEVVAAKERIAAAQQAEAEAEAALAKQREEAARSVADAERSLADARRDASREQEDASRALAKAEAEANQARIDSAKDVQKAHRDIADAEKDAADAAAELDRTRIDSAKDVAKARKDVADAEAEAAKATKDAARDVADAEEAVRKARQESARDQKKANQDVRDSWVELGGTVAVTTEQYLRELEKQVKDQEKWADNLISLAGRVPDEMLKELAELGPGGAKVVALATQMSDEELKKFIALHGKSGKEAGDVFAENLAAAGPVLREIARTRGQDVADKVREGMDGGRTSVFDAARRLGVEIDNGLEVDRPRVLTLTLVYNTENAPPRTARETGGIDRYAAGGIRPVGPMIATRPTVLFGEGRDDEAFIPYDQQYRARAEGLLSQVAGDFGGVFLKPLGAAAPGTGGGSAMVAGQGNNTYNITLQVPPNANMAQLGAVTVDAIQEFERRSGAGWRRG